MLLPAAAEMGSVDEKSLLGPPPPYSADAAAERQRAQFQAVLDKVGKHHANIDAFTQPPMASVNDLVTVIGMKNQKFDAFRSKNQKIYSALRKTLTPIEVVGGVVADAAAEAFPPVQLIYSGIMYFVTAARGVSEAYDSIVALLEQLSFFTKRLSLYVHVKMEPDTIDLLSQIMAVLFEVIIIATNAIGQGRAKAFLKNLFGGNDAIADAVSRLEVLFGVERGQIIAEIMKHVGDLQESVRDGFKDTHDALEMVQMNQGRLIEDLSRLEQSMQSLRKDESLHGDKLRLILNPCPYPEDLYMRFNSSMAKNTGSWIMQESSLASWICSEFPFLLMYGSPGVGKSYLTTYLVTSLSKLFSESGDPSAHNSLGYFFFRNDNLETKSPLQSLWDIAMQLADDDVYYSKYLLKTIASSEDIKTIPSAFRKLILEPIRADVRQRKVFLLFDGLDEAPWEEVKELLFVMKDLPRETDCNIQVLLTGRPELQEPITQVLDNGEGVSDILHYLHITPDKNRADVLAFIEESIMKARNMRHAKPDPDTFRRQVIKEISKKAGGVFIMAALMIAAVTSVHLKNPRIIMQNLKEYPSEVSDLLYKVVVGVAKAISPEQCEDLNECLMWVALAEETLTFGQITEILTLKLGAEPWDLENSLRGTFSSFFTLDRDDGKTTADLLDMREQSASHRGISPNRSDIPEDGLDFSSNPDQTDVVFFHSSIGLFFRSKASTNINVDGRHIGFDENKALIHIAETCLRLFAEPGVEDTRLHIYAARHWQKHVTRINLEKTPAADKTTLLRLVHRMLTDEPTVFNWTDFNNYKNFFPSHSVLLGLQQLLADSSAVAGLDAAKEASTVSWAKASATDLHAMVEPMGKVFSRAWLARDCGVSRQGVHKSTIVCLNFVQSVAYLKKPGYTWRSEQDDPKLSVKEKMETALEWADQEKNWWWHLRVGSTWMTLGEYAIALDHYDKAKSKGGDVISTSARIAVCYQRQRKFQEALDLYLICEAKEQELSESGKVTGQIAHINQQWRLYKDQILAAECYVQLNQIDEAAEYYRKAIKNSYDKSLFDAETDYIRLMIKHNRFKEISALLMSMDRPSSDPHKLGTRLVNFLITKAIESVVLEWIPRVACRKDVIPFAKDQYKIATNEAKREEDTVAERALLLGRGNFHIYARDYSHALEDLETMCYLYYRPKGSLPIRSIQTQALRRLAYLYKQLALHTETSGGRWAGRLETLEQKLKENQNLDVPIQLVGQSHNDATMYRGLLKRKGGGEESARKIFEPLVIEALDILDDDEPQNDTYALDNLARVLMAAGEIEDATGLHQSLRPPDSTIIASVVSEEKDEVIANDERREPTLPGIVTPTPFCMQCLDTLDDSQSVAICQFCLDPFCLKCLDSIKQMEIKKWEDLPSKRNSIASREEGEGGRRNVAPMILESSCRKDHEWVIVKPLGTQLRAGEILVGGKVLKMGEWKKSLREKWTSG